MFDIKIENNYFVYKIQNKINGKIYIGVTTRGIERFKEHICMKGEKNKPLYLAFDKYGIDSFDFEILEYIYNNDINMLYEKEKEYIKKYDSYNNGYNQTVGGDGFLNGSMHPFSKKNKNRKSSPNTKSVILITDSGKVERIFNSKIDASRFLLNLLKKHCNEVYSDERYLVRKGIKLIKICKKDKENILRPLVDMKTKIKNKKYYLLNFDNQNIGDVVGVPYKYGIQLFDAL